MVDAIAVLGGGEAFTDRRIAWALYHSISKLSYSHCPVILSGNKSAFDSESMPSEAAMMSAYLIANNISRSRLYLDSESNSTKENFLNIGKILSEQLPEVKSLEIITDKPHMPRALSLGKLAIPNITLYPCPVPIFWSENPKHKSLAFTDGLTVAATYPFEFISRVDLSRQQKKYLSSHEDLTGFLAQYSDWKNRLFPKK